MAKKAKADLAALQAEFDKFRQEHEQLLAEKDVHINELQELMRTEAQTNKKASQEEIALKAELAKMRGSLEVKRKELTVVKLKYGAEMEVLKRKLADELRANEEAGKKMVEGLAKKWEEEKNAMADDHAIMVDRLEWEVKQLKEGREKQIADGLMEEELAARDLVRTKTKEWEAERAELKGKFAQDLEAIKRLKDDEWQAKLVGRHFCVSVQLFGRCALKKEVLSEKSRLLERRG